MQWTNVRWRPWKFHWSVQYDFQTETFTFYNKKNVILGHLLKKNSCTHIPIAKERTGLCWSNSYFHINPSDFSIWWFIRERMLPSQQNVLLTITFSISHSLAESKLIFYRNSTNRVCRTFYNSIFFYFFW